VLAVFPASFGRLSSEKQQLAIDAVAAGAKAARLSGGVAAMYSDENGQPASVAADVYKRFLSRLTMEAAEKLLNRDIRVEWIDGDPTVAAPPPVPETTDAAKPAATDDDIGDRRRAVLTDKPFRRVLTEDDIRAVAVAFKEMGPEEFVQKFVRNQAISLQGAAQPMTPMMREYYVSIEQLRSAFFPGAEMRGSKRAFQSLTHLLDQLMLRSLPFLPTNGLPVSLNLNVHSILTKTFESALKTSQAELLTFEIPQPMIAQHFAEYKKAHDLVAAHGAKIAVDQIFPDTLGQLDLEQVGTNIAKLHWKGDLKNFSAAHRESVKRAIDRGVTMVMSRVDDPAAFKIAQEFGIQNFQGFLIDEMAGEASDGYLPLM
jgi:EAL domain-containing protein (putative c-di-GMP-specific phosphodiesterase class I)